MGEKLVLKVLAGWRPKVFVAIDFETANRHPNSACAVALARVEQGKLTQKVVELIRPPTSTFEFTHIHGIEWSDVKSKQPFKTVWKTLTPYLKGIDFLAAHNARFDQGVLSACCRESGIPHPPLPFICTVLLARKRWQLYPTRLPDVCSYLGFDLNHHDPLSDAEACAGIVLAATEDKFALNRFKGGIYD